MDQKNVVDQELLDTMEYIRANEEDVKLVTRLKSAAQGVLTTSGIKHIPIDEHEKALYNLAVDMITSFYYDNRGIVPLSNNVKNSVTDIVIKLSREARQG